MLAYKALKRPLRSAVPAGQSATTGFKILRVWLEECHLGISAADIVVLFTGSRAFLGRCYRLREGGLGRRHVPPGWTMRCLQRHRIVSDTAWPSTALPHVYSSRKSNRPMSQGWMFSTHIGRQFSPCYASSKTKKTFLSLSAWAAHVLFPDPGIPLTTTQAAELAPEGSFVSLDWMQGWMNWSTKARSPKRPGAPYLSKRLHSFCPTSGDTFCKRGWPRKPTRTTPAGAGNLLLHRTSSDLMTHCKFRKFAATPLTIIFQDFYVLLWCFVNFAWFHSGQNQHSCRSSCAAPAVIKLAWPWNNREWKHTTHKDRRVCH